MFNINNKERVLFKNININTDPKHSCKKKTSISSNSNFDSNQMLVKPSIQNLQAKYIAFGESSEDQQRRRVKRNQETAKKASEFQLIGTNPPLNEFLHENDQVKEDIRLQDLKETKEFLKAYGGLPKGTAPAMRYPTQDEVFLSFLPGGSAKTPAQLDKLFDPIRISQGIANFNGKDLINTEKYPELYKKSADEIAMITSRSANTNVLLVHEDGSMPELTAESYVINLRSGNYKGIGFDSDNTDVEIRDTKKFIAEHGTDGKSMVESLKELDTTAKKEGKNKVIFIKDFNVLMEQCANMNQYQEKNIPLAAMLDGGYLSNLKIVGMVPKKIYNDIENTKLQSGANRSSSDQLGFHLGLKSYTKIDLKSISPEVSKQILKDTPILEREIPTIKDKNVKLNPEFIDAAVESTRSSAGNYPEKAIEKIGLAIAAESLRNKILHNNAPINMTANAIEKLDKDYSNLRVRKKSDGGNFEVMDPRDIKVGFKDIGGMHGVKKEVEEQLMVYLKDPTKLQKDGIKIPKGILWSGDPGNGKTLLAKAIAKESGVPFIGCAASQFVEQFVGVGAGRVRDLFNTARDAAEHSDKKTAIVFIDEIDAVGKKRGAGGTSESEREQTLNQLLVEMNGINDKSDVTIIVMAATNRLELLDDALVRPGRLGDLKFIVNNPRTNEERREILEVHAKSLKFENKEKKNEVLNEIAASTDGLSGATLASIMEESARMAGRRNSFINIDDTKEALMRVRFGIKTEHDTSMEEQKETVKHEVAGHAVANMAMSKAMEGLALSFQPRRDIDLITFEPRGFFAGAVIGQGTQNKRFTFESLITELVICYSGGNSQKVSSGTNEDGSCHDLKQATGMIEKAVTEWGLGPNTKTLAPGTSESLKVLMGEDILKDTKLISNAANTISMKIVDFHKDFGEQYMKDYELDKSGKTLSGKEFKKEYGAWIDKEPGRKEKLDNLLEETRLIIQAAKKGIDVDKLDLEQGYSEKGVKEEVLKLQNEIKNGPSKQNNIVEKAL